MLRLRFSDRAPAWVSGLDRVANLTLLLAVAAGVAVSFSTIVSLLGWWTLATASLIVLASLAIGCVLAIAGAMAKRGAASRDQGSDEDVAT